MSGLWRVMERILRLSYTPSVLRYQIIILMLLSSTGCFPACYWGDEVVVAEIDTPVNARIEQSERLGSKGGGAII